MFSIEFESMDVLIVSDYAYPGGGVEVFLQSIIRAGKNFMNMTMVTWQDSSLGAGLAYDCDVFRIECGDYIPMYTLIESADIVFVQGSFRIRPLAVEAAKYSSYIGKPVLGVIHTSSSSVSNEYHKEFQQNYFVKFISTCDVVVCVSKSVADSVNSLCPKATAVVINNASRFVGNSFDSAPRINKDLTIAFIGRPTKSKGVVTFFKLVDKIRDSRIKWIVNSNTEPLNEDVKLDYENVSYLDNLTEDQMFDFYQSIDVLVLPYIAHEGDPLVVREALCFSHIDIIGYNSAGLGEALISNGHTVVSNNNYDGLLKAVQNRIVNGKSCKAIKASVSKTWDEVMIEYLSLFEKIV